MPCDIVRSSLLGPSSFADPSPTRQGGTFSQSLCRHGSRTQLSARLRRSRGADDLRKGQMPSRSSGSALSSSMSSASLSSCPTSRGRRRDGCTFRESRPFTRDDSILTVAARFAFGLFMYQTFDSGPSLLLGHGAARTLTALQTSTASKRARRARHHLLARSVPDPPSSGTAPTHQRAAVRPRDRLAQLRARGHRPVRKRRARSLAQVGRPVDACVLADVPRQSPSFATCPRHEPR